MCARWETGETLRWVRCNTAGLLVVAAFACATGESETDPTVMATTAPAVTTLLARTCCSLPVRAPPPGHASAEVFWLAGRCFPAKPETQCMVRLGLV